MVHLSPSPAHPARLSLALMVGTIASLPAPKEKAPAVTR